MSPEHRNPFDLPSPGSRSGSQASTADAREIGATAFPLFSETPFMSWHLQCRRLREREHLHPSCKALIKLWDEANGL